MTWVEARILEGDDNRLLEGGKNHVLSVYGTYTDNTVCLSSNFVRVEMRGDNVLQDAMGSKTEIKG